MSDHQLLGPLELTHLVEETGRRLGGRPKQLQNVGDSDASLGCEIRLKNRWSPSPHCIDRTALAIFGGEPLRNPHGPGKQRLADGFLVSDALPLHRQEESWRIGLEAPRQEVVGPGLVRADLQ